MGSIMIIINIAMKIFVPVVLLFFTYQVYASDLIILDNYYLERIERKLSDKVGKIKQAGSVAQTELVNAIMLITR